MTLLKSIRDFCAGVRAIRASLPMLQSVKETLDKLMREVEHSDIFRFNSELEAERGAHSETKELCSAYEREIVAFQQDARRFNEQLASETAARQEAERKLDDIIATAEEAGWNGVENPKNLCNYIVDTAEQLREAERKLDALKLRLAEAWSEGWDQRDRRESGGYANNPYHPKYQGINPAHESLAAAEKGGGDGK